MRRHGAATPLRSATTAHSRAAVLARLLERQAKEAAGSISPDGRGDGNILLEELVVYERELLRAPAGSWDPEMVEQVSWNREALGTLNWTLGWLDRIPPYDTRFQEDVLEAFSLGFRAGEVSYGRPASTIQASRDLAEAWHWRVRTRVLEDQIVAQGVDLVEVISEAAQYQHEHAGLVMADGDYSAFDKPFYDLTLEEFNYVANITTQRHRTLNWICGLASSWDDEASLAT